MTFDELYLDIIGKLEKSAVALFDKVNAAKLEQVEISFYQDLKEDILSTPQGMGKVIRPVVQVESVNLGCVHFT